MGTGFAPVRARGDDERAGGVNERIAPGIGTGEVRVGCDAVAECSISLANCQKTISEDVVDGFGQVVAYATG